MTIARDKTLGRIAFESQFDPSAWDEISDYLQSQHEIGALAVRDAVMADVIDKIRLYSMFAAKPGMPAMEYSQGLMEMLNNMCQASSEDDEAHRRGVAALHQVTSEDAK